VLRLLAVLIGALLSNATPSGDPLRGAWLRGDRQELGRAANRLGARGLAAAIARADGSRAETLAAIAAAPLADEAWALLEPLAARAGDHDRPIAAAAARAAAEIVRHFPAEAQAMSGAPVDELADAAARFAALAARAEIWPDVRVHALECALGLSPDAATLPVQLLGDHDAEVRRAAIGFADAGSAAVATRLGQVAASDEDAAIAAAAAAALCRAGVALPDAARARAAKIAGDPQTARLVDPGDTSSLRRCPPR